MSKEKIRENKTCLNCEAVVEKRFCPQCGQENTETRKSFHYLFTHFIEDLVHYDSGFWITMKYLLFYPGKLTSEYITGRRQSYVVPVKLYIFISFITFFLSGLFMTDFNTTGEKSFFKVTESDNKLGIAGSQKTDNNQNTKQFFDGNKYGWASQYKTVKEFDSVQNSFPESKKSSALYCYLTKKMIGIAEHNTQKDALNKFLLNFKQSIPKVLFFYMPLFAFSLWLFHGKKRWYYFDHGIFTLHYFSFMLLLTSLFIILEEILDFGNNTIINILLGLIRTVYILWIIIYFYKAHKRFYNESKFVSFLKSSALLFVNYILMFIVLICFMIYAALSIH